MSGAPATRQWAPKSAGQMMADDEEAQLAMETQTEKRQHTLVKTPNREAKKQNTTKEEEPEKMEGPEESEKLELNFELAALKDDLQVIHNKLNTHGNQIMFTLRTQADIDRLKCLSEVCSDQLDQVQEGHQHRR